MGAGETKLAHMTADEQRAFVSRIDRQNESLMAKLNEANASLHGQYESPADALLAAYLAMQNSCSHIGHLHWYLSPSTRRDCILAQEGLRTAVRHIGDNARLSP